MGTEPTHPLGDTRFAVIDVETSGLSHRRHQLLQVAVVTVLGDGRIVERWCSRVRLRYGWLSRTGPRRIHGLRRRDLRGAPRLAEVLAELASRLEGSIVVGHNVMFDVEFLRSAAHRVGVPLRISSVVCTLQLSRALDPDRHLSHRLGDVAQRHGVELARPHDALADAEATARILAPLLGAHAVSTLDELQLLDRSYWASTRLA